MNKKYITIKKIIKIQGEEISMEKIIIKNKLLELILECLH
jgi:hypothetical protein